MSFLATDVRTVFDVEATLLAADGTAERTLIAAQAGVFGISFPWLANTDAIDHHVQVIYTQGGIASIVAAITVPTGAGVGGVPVVQVGNGPFGTPNLPTPLGAGVAVGWRVEEAVTLANKVSLQTTVVGF